MLKYLEKPYFICENLEQWNKIEMKMTNFSPASL